MFTLGDICRKGVRLSARTEAVVFEGARLTYAAFDGRVNRLANALIASGGNRGDRVAVLAENSHHYLEIYFGVAKSGRVTTPLNIRLSRRELLQVLRDADIAAVFVGAGFEDTAKALRAELADAVRWISLEAEIAGWPYYEALLEGQSSDDPQADGAEGDLAALIYTGGTTGLPKGVMLSHRNILSALSSVLLQCGFKSGDSTCLPLPLFHVAFWPAFAHLMVGGRVVVLRRPEVKAICRAIQDERCTHINAVPTLYGWMVDDPAVADFDLSSLRDMTYSGSPFPEEVLRRCIQKFGPIFSQGYGLTEAAPTATFLGREDHVLDGPRSRLLTSAGREMILNQVGVCGANGDLLPPGVAGEVVVRGPNVMLGYWNNPDLTRDRLRDGWLHTGDVGMLDDDGYLFLLDRKADMIVTGGENVYPSETEGVLHKHGAVKECAVVSAPDPKWGERVHAVVVLKGGAEATEAELIAFCHEFLAGYKCPKKIEFWPELPKSAVGKILRKDVKSVLWQGRSRSIA